MAAYWRKTWPFHLLLLPALALVIVFQYIPLFGAVIAFQDYEPWLGIKNSPWVGLDHFKYLFTYPDGKQIIWNTLIISAFKLAVNLVIPIIFALLLNEVSKMFFKRAVQTFVYLPHFLSWVILGGIMIDILSTEGGIVNRLLNSFGIDSIFFLGNGNWFRFTVVLSDVWKEFGFSAIIFLATLVGINPALYEAAEIDGATRWQQVRLISVPLMMPIVIVVATLSLGRILDAGFDQILNIYNPLVYSHGDIIDTFVYREGLNNGQFSFGTAVGLFKSAIGFVLIVISYRLAFKLANYRIF
ncbi:ABC transporter permease [Paenibacillus sp. YIM B09110]|uniref:ABC transporter permease n=1 Tax=Paenibacillus sp. YIM B09110 TaxID=3126102 RepID=UPI00301BEE87